MNGACEPYQLLLNAYPGTRLVEGMRHQHGRLSANLSYRLVPRVIETKEYPRGQESYAVEFIKAER